MTASRPRPDHATPRRRPRILYVDHCARLSGAQLALLRLLTEMRGVEAYAVLAEDGPLAPALRDAGVPTCVLPMEETGRDVSRTDISFMGMPAGSVGATGRYIARLQLLIRSLQPDLVHTNSMKAALYGGIAGRIAGRPVLWHVRERLATDYMSASAVRIMQTAARVLPTAIVANSRETLGTLPPTRKPSVVIPSLVEVDRLGRARRERGDRPTGPLLIGMVGRIAPWKGQHVFLEAFARAFGRRPGAIAVVIGAPLFGEEDYERELRSLAGSLGIADRVRFTGFERDIPARLANLDVLVHASVSPEPFGQVVVEGMAAGLPVVASRAGGPLEVVTDGVDGLLFEPGAPTALAGLLTRLADDPALRERLGARALSTARSYAPDVIATRMLSTYRGVLGRPTARRSLRRPAEHDRQVRLQGTRNDPVDAVRQSTGDV